MVVDGYKQTEIGVIPEDWNTKKLGVSFNFKNGLNKSKEFFGYGTPIVNYMDVFNNYGLTEKDIVGRVDVNRDELKNYNVQKGDVFFTRTSETVDEIGITTVVIEDIKNTVFSGFILRARPSDGSYELGFKKYCFSSKIIRDQIIATSSYTTRALTNGTSLAKVIMPIPPKEEQKAIATVLSDVDALIASLERLIAKKEDIKTATMQQLLTGKKRLGGFSGEWKIFALPSIAWFQEGPGVRKYQFTKSGVKLLNGTNIFKGKITLETTDKYISSFEAYGAYKHFLADKDDIVIACSGITINKFEEKIAFVKQEHLPFCMNTSTMRFKVIKNLDKYFLYYFLMSDEFKSQIGGKATGSAQLNFGPSHVKKVKIKLPSIKEQTAITTILSDMESEIETLKTRLEKTKAIKVGIMQELLTGKTRLKI